MGGMIGIFVHRDRAVADISNTGLNRGDIFRNAFGTFRNEINIAGNLACCGVLFFDGTDNGRDITIDAVDHGADIGDGIG